MRNTEKERALKAAEDIFALGRIEDPEDFWEFRLELEFELSRRGESPQAIKRMIEYLKWWFVI